MSLISDALRKARQEASEREARARGLAVPERRRTHSAFGTGIAIGATVAAIAALAGGAAVWWALGGGGTATPATSGPVAAVTVASPTPIEAPSVAGAADGAPAASTDDLPLRAEEVTPGATPAAPQPSPTGATPTPAPTPTPAAILPPLIVADAAATAERDRERPPPTSPPTAPDGAAGPREFGLVAELGYARLELGYLISRPDDPFAEVNGVEVHVGSRVAGFRVEEIGKTFIRLSDDRGPVVLRVR